MLDSTTEIALSYAEKGYEVVADIFLTPNERYLKHQMNISNGGYRPRENPDRHSSESVRRFEECRYRICPNEFDRFYINEDERQRNNCNSSTTKSVVQPSLRHDLQPSDQHLSRIDYHKELRMHNRSLPPHKNALLSLPSRCSKFPQASWRSVHGDIGESSIPRMSQHNMNASSASISSLDVEAMYGHAQARAPPAPAPAAAPGERGGQAAKKANKPSRQKRNYLFYLKRMELQNARKENHPDHRNA